MRKTWLWLLAIALLPTTLLAQAVQPTAMYISSTGTIAGPWQPFMAAAGSESLGYVPVPGSALYYSSTGLKAGPWFPCTLALCFGGGGGGGATFTPTGIQYATSTTAASVVTPTQMFAAFSTQSANCFFAGPTTGSAATPTCRAMVVADLPTAIPNANLQNPSTTVNGQTCTLGSSCTVTSTYQPSIFPLPPAIGSFTWVNQQTTTTSTNGGMIMMSLQSDALGRKFLSQTAPVTPYSAASFTKSYAGTFGTQVQGIYLYDGTKTLGFELWTINSGTLLELIVTQFPTIASAGTTVLAISVQPSSGNNPILPLSFTGGMFMRWRNDGTTLFADVSPDGANWINLYSEAVAAFITPTSYGWGGFNASSGQPLYVSLGGWLTTASGSL